MLYQTHALSLRVIFVCVIKIVDGYVALDIMSNAILNLAGNSAFLSILGARLLFNIKEVSANGLVQGANPSFCLTMSRMDFAAPPQVPNQCNHNDTTVIGY